jgi:Domain of unknown function (DUF4349)
VKRSKGKRLSLAAAVAALFLALPACSSGDDDSAGGGGAEAFPSAADSTQTSGEEGGASKPGSGEAEGGPVAVSSQLGTMGPRIVQTASLGISVRKDRLEDAVAQARTVAVGFGGFVVSSSVSERRHGVPASGSLAVRVPLRSYARAMSSLSAVGRVDAREESGEDVSQEFVDLEARARHFEAVERQLLQLLGRARTVSAALAVQSQLNAMQLELERVRGRLRFLEDQTAFATISLSIRERPAAPAGRGDGWGIVDAWADGARAFTNVAGKIFIVLAGAAPLVILLGLSILAVPSLRRRVRPPWRVSRT